LRPPKTIKTNGDWGITFTQNKHTILFAYLHHSDEFNGYEEYSVGQLAGVKVSKHLRVLNLDCAI